MCSRSSNNTFETFWKRYSEPWTSVQFQDNRHFNSHYCKWHDLQFRGYKPERWRQANRSQFISQGKHFRVFQRIFSPVNRKTNLQAKCWHLKTSIERNTHNLWLVAISTKFAKIKADRPTLGLSWSFIDCYALFNCICLTLALVIAHKVLLPEQQWFFQAAIKRMFF